jgi:NAD(P)H-hydrate epimerase
VIPIVTPEEMAAIDAAAPEPVGELIARAGSAATGVALDLLGGTYGRRVVVLAGKGNNGNDGRDLAARLARRGVRVDVVDVGVAPDRLPPADLVVDAAFGTGFRGEYRAPDVDEVPVLAIDIPSGVDGCTGEASERVLAATRTVTFAALKPGLLLPPGSALAGDIDVADIGLDTSGATAWLVEDDDLVAGYPERGATAHKWQRALWVIGGSPGLEGAAVLTSSAAGRTGAGYVRWSSPGGVPDVLKPTEVVGTELPRTGWGSIVLDDADRFGALTIGNGLGLDESHRAEVRQVVAEAEVPVVVDADALTLLGDRAGEVVRPTTVLTPHDGEFARLAGSPPGPDRFAAARALAVDLGAIVLAKGPTTVVAGPDGRVRASASGDARLATLGSGDVLAGIIGALCAMGADPFEAAALGAHLHGRVAEAGPRHGLVAGDLVDLLPATLDRLLPAAD